MDITSLDQSANYIRRIRPGRGSFTDATDMTAEVLPGDILVKLPEATWFAQYRKLPEELDRPEQPESPEPQTQELQTPAPANTANTVTGVTGTPPQDPPPGDPVPETPPLDQDPQKTEPTDEAKA